MIMPVRIAEILSSAENVTDTGKLLELIRTIQSEWRKSHTEWLADPQVNDVDNALTHCVGTLQELIQRHGQYGTLTEIQALNGVHPEPESY